MGNRKWLVAALIVSLAVNLALAGFVAGRMSAPGPAPAMLDPAMSLFRVVRHLPDERREAFQPPLREHFRALRGDLRRMREAQRDINLALEEEPFQPQALAQSLSDFRDALLTSQQANHALLVRLAAEMTPQERLALREAMARRGPRPGRGDPHPHAEQ